MSDCYYKIDLIESTRNTRNNLKLDHHVTCIPWITSRESLSLGCYNVCIFSFQNMQELLFTDVTPKAKAKEKDFTETQRSQSIHGEKTSPWNSVFSVSPCEILQNFTRRHRENGVSRRSFFSVYALWSLCLREIFFLSLRLGCYICK